MVFWVVIGVCVATLSTSSIVGKEVALWACVSFIIGVGIALCFGIFQQRQMQKSYAPEPDGYILGERKLTLSPRGITEESTVSTNSISWSAIRDILVGPNVIVLKFDTLCACLIPTRIFETKAEQQQLLTSIREFRSQHSTVSSS